MKKALWMMVVALLWLTACNNDQKDNKPGKEESNSSGNTGNNKDSCKIACEDTLIIAAWKKIFSGDDKEMAKRDIEVEVKDTILVKGCIEAYQQALAAGTIKTASYTESIAYGSSALSDWLTKKLSGFNHNYIKIYIGMYTADFAKEYSKAQGHEGRLTVFLWPHHDEERASRQTGGSKEYAKIFNLGDLKP
jgi:major membrane immunogen (membrane-anchored lipoprotein)